MINLLTLGFFNNIKSSSNLIVKLLISGISPLTSFALALRVVLAAKLLIYLEYFFVLALCISFLKTSFFKTSLNLLKSTGTGSNVSTSNLSTLLFKLLKLVGKFFSLSISNLSTLDFRLAKSTFLAKDNVSVSAKVF